MLMNWHPYDIKEMDRVPLFQTIHVTNVNAVSRVEMIRIINSNTLIEIKFSFAYVTK